ncbi:helix-turn-helix domain-containing protein [Fusicatenibacter sp. CLA-AA-H213]|nr:helix-turn-helix domain-containing protein [Fusicatenibacter sp. CLA-AA-H213]
MAKNAHLVLDERATIEVRLRERASFTEIGRELGKDSSTISKEVRLHSQTVRKDSFNPCSKRSTCDEYGTACSKCKLQYLKSCKRRPRVKCYEHCKQFEVLVCNKLKKPPYVCNGCIQRQSCKLEKHIYSAKSAQKNYETTRSESRQGIAITPEELKRVDAIVSPLVKLGQSIHMICVNNADDIMLDEKTIYTTLMQGFYL